MGTSGSLAVSVVTGAVVFSVTLRLAVAPPPLLVITGTVLMLPNWRENTPLVSPGPSPVQAAAKSFRPSIASDTWVCAPLVVLLSRNSLPSAVPVLSYLRANTPLLSPAPLPSHAMMKLPAESIAIDGLIWSSVVVVLTITPAPTAAPAAS